MDRVTATLLLVVTALIAALFGRSVHDVSLRPVAEGGGTEWVVPPGREVHVMQLVAPALDRGVSGRAVESVQIEGGEIHLRLEGGGAAVVSADGFLAPSPVIAFQGVVDDDELAAALVARSASEVFSRASSRDQTPATGPTGRSADDAGIGLLGPAAVVTGLSPSLLVGCAFLFSVLLFAPFVWHVREEVVPPIPPMRWWLVGALVIGAALRVWFAFALPVELDEAMPLTNGRPLFTATHDAWVHPPLFRALGLYWVELIGWHRGQSSLLLRLPFVAASATATVLIASAVHRVSRGAPVACFALVPILVAPQLVLPTTLARPYSISVFLCAVVLFTVSATALTRSRALLCLLAIGAMAWTDLLGAVLIALVPFVWMGSRSRAARLSAAGLVVAVSVVVLPLVPGALELITDPSTGIGEGPMAAAVLRGQMPGSGIGSGEIESLALQAAALATFGADSWWLGPIALLLLVSSLWHARSRADLGAALVFAFVVVVVVGSLRSLRPRNVMGLPMLAALVGAVALVELERRRARYLAKRRRQPDERGTKPRLRS